MFIQDNLRELELELSRDMFSMRFKTNWLLMFNDSPTSFNISSSLKATFIFKLVV